MLSASKIPLTGRCYSRAHINRPAATTTAKTTTVSNHRVSSTDFKRAMKTFAGHERTPACTFVVRSYDDDVGDALRGGLRGGYGCNLKGSGHVGSVPRTLDQTGNVSFSRFPEMHRNTELSRSVYFDGPNLARPTTEEMRFPPERGVSFRAHGRYNIPSNIGLAK